VQRHEIGEVVILDADTNTVSTPFDDLNNLPQEVVRIEFFFWVRNWLITVKFISKHLLFLQTHVFLLLALNQDAEG
jgi:hypothetical protein